MAKVENKETYTFDENSMSISRDNKGNVVALTFHCGEKNVEFSEDELTTFLRLMHGLRIELKRG